MNSNNANPVVGGFQTQAKASGNYGLSSNWVIYNGGYLTNDIKQKNVLLESANLSVHAAENDITLQITQAYPEHIITKRKHRIPAGTGKQFAASPAQSVSSSVLYCFY